VSDKTLSIVELERIYLVVDEEEVILAETKTREEAAAYIEENWRKLP
jgi:hypothetical protein